MVYITVNTIPTISNLYGVLANYDVSSSKNFSQFNYNKQYNLNSVFTTFGDNTVYTKSFLFSDSLNTFNQISVNYTFTPSTVSYGTNIINYPFSYLNNYNFYADKTCLLGYFRPYLSYNIKSHPIQGMPPSDNRPPYRPSFPFCARL